MYLQKVGDMWNDDGVFTTIVPDCYHKYARCSICISVNKCPSQEGYCSQFMPGGAH